MKNLLPFAVFLLLLVSCEALGFGVVVQPAAAWVNADRATFSTVAPRFQAYLEADSTLTPVELELFLGLLEDWDFRVRTAEAALELPKEPAQ